MAYTLGVLARSLAELAVALYALRAARTHVRRSIRAVAVLIASTLASFILATALRWWLAGHLDGGRAALLAVMAGATVWFVLAVWRAAPWAVFAAGALAVPLFFRCLQYLPSDSLTSSLVFFAGAASWASVIRAVWLFAERHFPELAGLASHEASDAVLSPEEHHA